MFSRAKRQPRKPSLIQQARALSRAVGVSLYGAEGVALAVVVIRREGAGENRARPLSHVRPKLGG